LSIANGPLMTSRCSAAHCLVEYRSASPGRDSGRTIVVSAQELHGFPATTTEWPGRHADETVR
jgi:hypothetical protein